MEPSLRLELGTPDATRVQDAVQRVLVAHDLATPDDAVMAEYVTVMMANRKGPSTIADELRDLVGAEMSSPMIQTLWEQAEKALQGTDAPPAPAARRSASPRARSASPPPPPPRADTSRAHDRWEHNDAAPRREKPRAQERELFPAGRRRGDAPRRERAARDKPREISILGRAGVPDPRAPPFEPSQMPPPMAAMAAMAAMASGASLFSRLDPMMPNNPPPSAAVPAAVQASRAQTAFPTEPTQTALCRWSLQCTNPLCSFSHPSPANAGRGGNPSALVLREDACPDGAQCKDKECVRSHVSPAVAFLGGRPPAAAAPSAPPCRFQAQCTNSQCTYTHYDAHGAVVPPPARTARPPAQVPCRFGAACTRPDCAFQHDKSRVACRFGDQCTRADCRFTHPRDGPARPTSERLAAFAAEPTEPERIVPGEITADVSVADEATSST